MLKVIKKNVHQLLGGASDSELREYQLSRESNNYHYTRQGNAAKVEAISDRSDYKACVGAFTTLRFSTAETSTIWKTVSAILHLV